MKNKPLKPVKRVFAHLVRYPTAKDFSNVELPAQQSPEADSTKPRRVSLKQADAFAALLWG